MKKSGWLRVLSEKNKSSQRRKRIVREDKNRLEKKNIHQKRGKKSCQKRKRRRIISKMSSDVMILSTHQFRAEQRFEPEAAWISSTPSLHNTKVGMGMI